MTRITSKTLHVLFRLQAEQSIDEGFFTGKKVQRVKIYLSREIRQH